MEEKRIQTNIYSMKTIRDMFSQKKQTKNKKTTTLATLNLITAVSPVLTMLLVPR